MDYLGIELLSLRENECLLLQGNAKLFFKEIVDDVYAHQQCVFLKKSLSLSILGIVKLIFPINIVEVNGI